ncbi:hypothetical protein GCM10022206_77390 [Streptomyces chiangmaiensis]
MFDDRAAAAAHSEVSLPAPPHTVSVQLTQYASQSRDSDEPPPDHLDSPHTED